MEPSATLVVAVLFAGAESIDKAMENSVKRKKRIMRLYV
jgi:hypothetical protein